MKSGCRFPHQTADSQRVITIFQTVKNKTGERGEADYQIKLKTSKNKSDERWKVFQIKSEICKNKNKEREGDST